MFHIPREHLSLWSLLWRVLLKLHPRRLLYKIRYQYQVRSKIEYSGTRTYLRELIVKLIGWIPLKCARREVLSLSKCWIYSLTSWRYTLIKLRILLLLNWNNSHWTIVRRFVFYVVWFLKWLFVYFHFILVFYSQVL